MQSTCEVPGCTNRCHCRGMCGKHYTRWRLHGDPAATLMPGRDMTPEQRLNYRTDKSGECWLYGTGDGYGKVTIRRTESVPAHRLAYQLAYGPIPDGLVVRHKCDTPRCVRPEHLEVGTHADNSKDMTTRQRQARGQQQGSAKITEGDVVAIREMARSGVTQTEIASAFGISRSEASSVIRGDKWSHVPGALPPRFKRSSERVRTEIIAAVLAGDTHEAAGKAHGVKRAAVSQIMRRYRKASTNG